MLCRKCNDGITFFLFELHLKLQDPLVLHVSGINEFLDPIGLLLVLVMQLAMKCLVLLQKFTSVNAGSESAYTCELAEFSGSKYHAGENLSQT